MIAITFALPEESQDFLGMLRHSGITGPAEYPVMLGDLGTHEVVIGHTGMGEARVRERLPQLFEQRRLDLVISAGYAGGLDPSLPAGALILAENYSDPALLARARTVLGSRCRIVPMATSPAALETPAAKSEFGRQTGAMAVDMETRAVAELCRKHRVPLLSARVITDTALEELAVPFSVCFDAKTERPRIGSLLAFLLRNPGRVRGFIHFVMAVSRARHLLTEALVEVVEAL